MNTPEEYIAAMQPKLCINCKHIGRNGSGDASKYKCFATFNVECRRTDLVTGETIVGYRHVSCYDARLDYGSGNTSCGPEGKWFEEAPMKFEEPMRIGATDLRPGGIKHVPVAADLLSQLDKL